LNTNCNIFPDEINVALSKIAIQLSSAVVNRNEEEYESLLSQVKIMTEGYSERAAMSLKTNYSGQAL
jgi:hypothetical protein